jgi:hypothetical protein
MTYDPKFMADLNNAGEALGLSMAMGAAEVLARAGAVGVGIGVAGLTYGLERAIVPAHSSAAFVAQGVVMAAAAIAAGFAAHRPVRRFIMRSRFDVDCG